MQSNSLGLPLITICENYEFLLDTGSKEVWLADDSCRTCQKTSSICPFLEHSNKKIEYVKGFIQGDFIFMNNCFGSQKIFCAKV